MNINDIKQLRQDLGLCGFPFARYSDVDAR